MFYKPLTCGYAFRRSLLDRVRALVRQRYPYQAPFGVYGVLLARGPAPRVRFPL